MRRWMMALFCLLALAPAWAQKSSAPSTGMPSVVVAGLLKTAAILSVDGTQRMLKIGQVSPEGIKLIEVSSRDALLEINGVQKRYALGMAATGFATVSESNKPSISITMSANGQFITSGTINGNAIMFLVDTGANSVALTAEHARILGIDYRVRGQRSRASTAGGVVDTYVVVLNSVKVGPIEVPNVMATVIESEHGMDQVLLGMTFLNQVKISQEGNTLMLTKKL